LEIVCPSWCSEAEFLTDAIPLLADQGVTAVEIRAVSNHYFDHRDGARLQTLMDALASSGVRVNSIHAPFGPEFDISSPEDSIHERGVDGLIESIELAQLLGAGVVIFHASDRVPDNPGRRLDRSRGVVREIAHVAEESGIILALENLPPGYLTDSPEEVFTFLQETARESLGVCFDSGHANLSGRFPEYANALLPFSVAIHIHDNDGRGDDHDFPGTGTINWPEFGSIYRSSGCEASLTLECHPPSGVTWSEAFQRLRVILEG